MPVPSFSRSKSPLVWERAWQMELDRRFPKHLSASQMPCMTGMDTGLPLSEGTISCATSSHDQLCTLQHDLLKLAGEKCANDNFEEKWRSVGDEVRAKHYFEAMGRVCEVPDMEEHRRFAPEVSLKQFQTSNGQGYLDLMQLLMPQRNLPEHYVRIEHPLVDAMLGLNAPFETGKPVATNPPNFMRQMMDIRRCLLTTFVVWNILLSFYDLSETVVNVKTSTKSSTKRARDFASALGNKHLSKEKISAIAKETNQLQKEKGVWVCAFCAKFESQASEALKSCGRCKTIDRIVMYCDRDCQENDWRRGNPPHKTTCGKPTSSIPPTQPPPPVTGSIPSKARTFRRSPALLRQISLLERDIKVDYVLVQPAPLPDYGIAFQAGITSVLFRTMRDRAFETGDPRMVRAMYKQLRDTAMKQAGYQLDWLERQLKVEFGVDVIEVTEEGL